MRMHAQDDEGEGDHRKGGIGKGIVQKAMGASYTTSSLELATEASETGPRPLRPKWIPETGPGTPKRVPEPPAPMDLNGEEEEAAGFADEEPPPGGAPEEDDDEDDEGFGK